MSETVRVSLPDGSAREFPAGTTVLEVAEAIGPRLARDTVAVLHGERRGTWDPSDPSDPRSYGVLSIAPLGHRFRVVLLPADTDLSGLCALQGRSTLLSLRPEDRVGARLVRHPPGRRVPVTVYRARVVRGRVQVTSE
ncbi:MAG: TGS domain-containing protein, partial [bacterium]|nr:TGS domain-containing protein [bacterium]